MESQNKKSCVYIHRVAGEIIYVGKGNSKRPFARFDRNDAWRDAVSRNGKFDVEIVAWFGSEEEALVEEKRLIHLYKPLANRVDNGWKAASRAKKTSIIRFRIEQEKKEKFSEAADKVGLSLSSWILMQLKGGESHAGTNIGRSEEKVPHVVAGDASAKTRVEKAEPVTKKLEALKSEVEPDIEDVVPDVKVKPWLDPKEARDFRKFEGMYHREPIGPAEWETFKRKGY